MADAGQKFTAAGMLEALGRKAHREFVVGEPWRDGVPGILRAGLLVAFHFYVWVAFWQASGGMRTAADDRAIRRLRLGFLTFDLVARAADFGMRARSRLAARLSR
jgi:hypothetical protein